MAKILQQGETIGSYWIVRRLGGGGMGQVYEAEHMALGVRRALKIYSGDAAHIAFLRRRFLEEGRVLARLSHPRIVKICDFEIDAATGLPYFAMDIVLSPDGRPRTLEEERQAGLDEERAAAVFADVCEGLDYMHSRGIAHGDVKLENVLIGPDGRAVITDFGISLSFVEANLAAKSGGDRDAAGCDAALFMGTPCYSAPETANAPHIAASPAADAWSLGVMMFRLLTGLWFEDANREKCLALLDDSDLPWRKVVGRLCSRDPERRMAGGRLAPLAAGMADAAERAASRPGRRRFLATAAVAATLVAATVAAVLVLCPEGAIEATSSPARLTNSADGTAHRCANLDKDSPAGEAFFAQLRNARRRILLAESWKMDEEARQILVDFIERQESYWCCDRYWPKDKIERIDSLVAARMSAGERTAADTARLLAIAGEVYREKRLTSFWRGEFPDDVRRIATLARDLVLDASDLQIDVELAFDMIEATVPFDRLGEWDIGANDPEYQGRADPWLAKMIRASVLGAESARACAGNGASREEDAREHETKAAMARRLLKEAYDGWPGRYRSAELMIGLSHDDVEAATRWFEVCQKMCFDDMRAWRTYARVLVRSDGGAVRLAEFLDCALETERYDTLVPAFYAIGRWAVLAKFGGKDGVAGADARAWAYDDETVREKTLGVIRRCKDGESIMRAPRMRRNVLLAVFAAAALTCGDEGLAKELVRRLPEEEFAAIVGVSVNIDSHVFRRLAQLRSEDENGINGGNVEL